MQVLWRLFVSDWFTQGDQTATGLGIHNERVVIRCEQELLVAQHCKRCIRMPAGGDKCRNSLWNRVVAFTLALAMSVDDRMEANCRHNCEDQNGRTQEARRIGIPCKIPPEIIGVFNVAINEETQPCRNDNGGAD